jgi:hypothetical protein
LQCCWACAQEQHGWTAHDHHLAAACNTTPTAQADLRHEAMQILAGHCDNFCQISTPIVEL